MSQASGTHDADLIQYNKPYALGKREIPSIGHQDILVRVHAAGFCHSDLQALQGQFTKPSPLGLVPSHEIAGTVARLGQSYAGDFKVGDRVGILNFKHACGSCAGCKLWKRTGGRGRADPRFCEHRETAGFLHDGGFADYVVADPETTIKLPDALSFEQAAPLMCAGATVWGSLEKATAGLGPGDTVAIVGIGGLGHLGLQFAKALGFRTVAADSRLAARQLAQEEMAQPGLRPDLVVDSSDTRAATAEILDATGGEGVAAVVVCTDSIPANRWAPEILRIGGVMGLLGLPPEPYLFDASLIIHRELTIRGSYVAGREATQRMIGTVVEAGIRSHLTTISFAQIPRIIDMYEHQSFKGRLVVRMGDT